MNLLAATVLAVVEGLTEFLPVSSTGHLILAVRILGISPSAFVSTFEIGIQLGAILAVVSLYLKRILGNYRLWKKLGIAFLPTVAIGFLMYPFVKTQLSSDTILTPVMLVLGGVVLIFWEKWHRVKKGKIEELSWQKCIMVGLGQSISLVPGVSRAMVTMMAGVGVGLSRTEAVEMSFLLAVPTMLAAVALDVSQTGGNMTQGEWGILIFGSGIAYVVATLTVKWLTNFVKQSDLSRFGWYRIAVGLVWLLA